jgi:MFS transporter, PPP family, 3-phenylpropionic acid transporter
MAAWGALPRFICLYAALYAAFGVSSPFLPALIASRGIEPEQIGILFAAATTLRLLSGPIAARIADRFHVLRLVFATCAVLAAAAVLCYLPAARFASLLVVSLLHAAMLAPLTVLADALALGAAVPRDDDASHNGFEYGWVRGAGSAAFIAGSLASGQVIGAGGLSTILWLSAALLGASAAAVLLVAEVIRSPAVRTACDEAVPGGIHTLLRLQSFRRLVIIAALVLGSHAMHDSFAVIRWREAGISPATISVLWSEAVAAEVLVFFVIGPALVRRLTPAGAVTLAAGAGVLRWTVMAQSADVALMATVQPLHGVTFALLHLAAMRIIATIVPRALAATAQAIYGTVGIGAATALLTLASGAIYGRAGAEGFWLMAALCAIALPLSRGLRGQPA